MAKENNKMQVDIDTLKKQNVNDLLSIKELYSKLEELGEKITQVKYIDNTLVKKIKKEYGNLKKIILDENIQVQLDNKIDEFNVKLTNNINSINTQMDNIVKKQNLERLNVITHFGVKNDGTDTTEQLNNAINSGYPLYFPKGEYLHTNKITITNNNTPDWLGEGSNKTIIKFNNYNIESGIYRKDCVGSNWKMKGITFDGMSKTGGTNRHGIYSDVRSGFPQGSRPSYSLNFEDIACVNWSGDGFKILDWFQQKYVGCYARWIGKNGFQLGGDQFTSFINSMNFNVDIDGASWWFTSGTPFLQGLNCGNVGIGLKLGSDSTHEKGISYCKPTICGLNIEHVKPNGTGIYIENGSSINNLGGITIYADGNYGNVKYGVYAKYLNDLCLMTQGFTFNQVNGGTFENSIFVAGFNAKGGFLYLNSFDDTQIVNNSKCIITLHNNLGNITSSNPFTCNGIELKGKLTVPVVKVTSNYTIRRDIGQQDDFIILADATNGAINISIDYASYLSKRQLTIKKVDDSSNGVTISPLGGNLEGNPNYFMNTQYSTITIVSDGSKWHIINKI